MAIVAKSVLVFASAEDRNKVACSVPWMQFIMVVGDGGENHPRNLGYPVDHLGILSFEDLLPQDLTVTRKWQIKKNAEDYVDWMTAQFATLNITPVSFTVEDYTE